MSNFKEYGRIASEINVSYVGSNNTACGKFSLAVDRVFGKDKDGKKITDFHPIQAWGKSAELLEKLGRKGDRIVVEGTVQNNNYEKDGVKHYGYVINADRLQFVETKKDRQSEDGGNAPTQNTQQQIAPPPAKNEPDDDFIQIDTSKTGNLPFFDS